MFRLRRIPGDVFVIYDDKDLIARIKFGNIKGEETPESVAQAILETIEAKLTPPQTDPPLTEA